MACRGTVQINDEDEKRQCVWQGETDGKISIYRVESVYLFTQNDDVIVVDRSRRKQITGKWVLCEW